MLSCGIAKLVFSQHNKTVIIPLIEKITASSQKNALSEEKRIFSEMELITGDHIDLVDVI